MRPSLPTRGYAWWEPENKRYVDRREVKASYWKNGRMSPGLLRARRQFRTPNMVAGALLLTFVAGVFYYSMAAVKQDIFDDLDEEARRRAVQDAKRSALTVEDEKRAMAVAASRATGPVSQALQVDDKTRNNGAPESSAPDASTTKTGGVLSSLTRLVWGAPSVDKEDKSKSV
ncbi:Coiled-coil-56 domain-containing protein [Mycena sanguinolenta]|uniref:Cytochrome c oxidase assembly factor 3 n=1 Tax=Mycena sanguinolenta TaxID=230812 RepID=A0A8H6X765_9AGAR|nr:Coiled-coil-56 domain-containing protein [Mycena sanguinolenta]